jgi:hypothetical protein
MKLKLNLIVILFLGVAMSYTGCKKSGSAPSDPKLAPQDVANKVAANISQSFFGGLGAFDISAGLSAPGTVALHNSSSIMLNEGVSATGHSRAIVRSFTNPYCGLVIDTTLNYSLTVKDTSVSITGSVKFNFICTNNVVSGYNTNDNLSISYSGPQVALTYKVAEIFTAMALNPQSAGSNLSLNGSLNSSGAYQYKTGTKRSGSEVFNYTLTSIIINPNTNDIVSGSATFNSSGSGPKGVWSYQGTITFTGNHSATVTISGKAYTVHV